MRGLSFTSHGTGASRFAPTGNLSAVHIRPVGAGTGSVMFGSVADHIRPVGGTGSVMFGTVADALAIPVPVATASASAPPPAWTIENGRRWTLQRFLQTAGFRSLLHLCAHVLLALVAAIAVEILGLVHLARELLGL